MRKAAGIRSALESMQQYFMLNYLHGICPSCSNNNWHFSAEMAPWQSNAAISTQVNFSGPSRKNHLHPISLALPTSLSLSLALAGFHLAKAFVLASEPAADVECADGVCTVKLASTFLLEWQRKVLCASRRRRRRQRRIVLQRRMKVCNIKFLLSNK